MAVSNSLQANRQPKFTAVINSDGYKRMINNTLGDPNKAARFITAITSAVSNNPALQDCDAATIVSAGLLGEALNLSPSPQLGQYYLIPYKDRKTGRMVAQFQIGYKGYIQLAMKSGQYKKMNVLPIKAGELIHFDPLDEEIKVRLIENELDRESAETIGYYVMFEYINGFRKAIYWSRQKMESHAERYSMGYKAHKGYTFWEKDFDGMACKTMLRQLISKWGIMSIDMQKAVASDMGVIGQSGSVDYIDTPTEAPQAQPEQPHIIDVNPMPENVPPDDDFAALLEG